MILKILQAEPEFIIETYQLLIPKIILSELTTIMNMKGIKKSEQQQLIHTYNTKVDKQHKIIPNQQDVKSVRNLFKSLI